MGALLKCPKGVAKSGYRGLVLKGSGAARRSIAYADEAAREGRQAQGQGRGMPQGGEAQESQGAGKPRNRSTDTPTGRGMKPLKRSRRVQQCLMRRKRGKHQ